MSEYERVLSAWSAITEVLALAENVSMTDIGEHLQKTSKPRVAAVQFILLGLGCATDELVPDGHYAEQTRASIQNLHQRMGAVIEELYGGDLQHLILPITDLSVPISECHDVLPDGMADDARESLPAVHVNALARNNIFFVGQLVVKNEKDLRAMGLGDRGCRRIRIALESLGLSLDAKLDKRVDFWLNYYTARDKRPRFCS